MFRLDLDFRFYKILSVQQLKDVDFLQWENFAVRMQVIFEDSPNATELPNDEVRFHLNGSVNKQNFRYWSP